MPHFVKMSRHMSVRQIITLDKALEIPLAFVDLENHKKFPEISKSNINSWNFIWVFRGMGIWPNDQILVEMTICGQNFSDCQFFDSWHFKEIRLTIKLYLTTVRTVFRIFKNFHQNLIRVPPYHFPIFQKFHQNFHQKCVWLENCHFPSKTAILKMEP